MVKTPRDGYYAVRYGKGVRSCLFFNWEDCKVHVEEGGADYKVFDSLEEAAAYATSASLDTLAAAVVTAASEAAEDKVAATNINEGTTKKRKTPVKTTAVARAKRARTNDGDTVHVQSKAVVSSRLRQPTKKWEAMFAKLKEFQQQDGSLLLESGDEAMRRWIRSQNDHYRLFKENKPSSMYQEKINRLRTLGFVFRVDQAESTSRRKQTDVPRRIYKQWEESRQKLKLYMDSHSGSWEIDKSEKEYAKLRHWVMEQQCEFRRLQEGQEGAMTEEKLQRLSAIGVNFSYVKWHERVQQLQTFKEEHGHIDVPNTHEEMGPWVTMIRKQYKTASDGKPKRYLTPERIGELKMMGFVFERSQNVIDFHDDFEECFETLKKYKKENGDCLVKRHPHTNELHNWVSRVRKEYKKLQDGRPCRLTVQQLQRLTDVGFVFRQKDGYLAFEHRVEELRQFKALHGHLNITTKHPELGEFIGRQRKQYKWRMNGQKSPMSDERIAILEELGFDFQVDNWRDPVQIQKPKAWEERFDELMSFKELHGHTIVPQHTAGLGSWVKKQRKDLKAFRKGEKSPMTAQKAMKLSEVGFVIDVFELRKLRKRYDSDEEY